MLGELRPCRACGGVHEGRPVGFQHPVDGGCPVLSIEDFALVSHRNGDTGEPPRPLEDPGFALPPTSLAVPFSTVPDTDPDDTRPLHALEVPWLRPPDLSGVI
jgi:hypothetical protein